MEVCRKRSRHEKFILATFCTLFIIFMSISHGPAQESAPTITEDPVSESVPQETANPDPSSNPALLELIKTVNPEPPPQKSSSSKEVLEALQEQDFSYPPAKLSDPFISFIVPVKAPQPELAPIIENEDLPPEPPKPLTPLQKMSLGEIEKGLKAILWGEMGRRAVIEDSTGKGYIVGVGTSIAGSNGVITEIFDDRLVIQQEVWDKGSRTMVPQNLMVKLNKKQNI
jgi:Tfp pilus assembly protein PilP